MCCSFSALRPLCGDMITWYLSSQWRVRYHETFWGIKWYKAKRLPHPDLFFPMAWRRLSEHDAILSNKAAAFFPVSSSPDPSPGVDEEHSAEPVRKLLSSERRRTVNASRARHGYGGREDGMTGKFNKKKKENSALCSPPSWRIT